MQSGKYSNKIYRKFWAFGSTEPVKVGKGFREKRTFEQVLKDEYKFRMDRGEGDKGPDTWKSTIMLAQAVVSARPMNESSNRPDQKARLRQDCEGLIRFLLHSPNLLAQHHSTEIERGPHT